MRTANSKNTKKKYNLKIELMGETKCDEDFASLIEVSKKFKLSRLDNLLYDNLPIEKKRKFS